MNPPKCNEYDYIDFLNAAPKVSSCTEAENRIIGDAVRAYPAEPAYAF